MENNTNYLAWFFVIMLAELTAEMILAVTKTLLAKYKVPAKLKKLLKKSKRKTRRKAATILSFTKASNE